MPLNDGRLQGLARHLRIVGDQFGIVACAVDLDAGALPIGQFRVFRPHHRKDTGRILRPGRMRDA